MLLNTQTHVFIHPLILRLQPAIGSRNYVQSIFLRSPEAHILIFEQKCMQVVASRWMRTCKHQNVGCESARDYSARLVFECAVWTIAATSFMLNCNLRVCLPTCRIISSSVALLLNVHSSITGESCHWAKHPLILRLFQWSNKNSGLVSALKINSSIGTGGLCTT